jgi:translocation and assembly module TamB
MASETEHVTEIHTIPRGRVWARRTVKWTGITVGTLILLLLLFWVWLNSDFGKRFVVKQINGLEMASGLDIGVGSIEGSLFGKLTLHNLTLSDPKGRFFAANQATMDWRPLAYFSNHVDIRSLDIPKARLWRLPELRPGDPNAPMLPDINMDIGRLTVGRIYVDPTVTGYRHLVSLDGRARIADRRAQVALNAAALAGPGVPGGDHVVLRLDAVPDQNKLDLGLKVDAPGNGFVASLTGLSQPLAASVNGRGSWKDWNGRAIAQLGGKAFANFGINAKSGTFTVNGQANPGLMLAEGPVKRLLQPLVQVNLVTTMANRRADTKLRLSSQAGAVAAEGAIDLGRSEFGDLKLAVRLAEPRAIAPGLTARGLRLAAVLNGAFKTPTVLYDLTADSLGFNGKSVEGLRARGRAKVDADRITLPVAAHAARITGLDPSVGGLLTNVSANGTLNISGSTILSDDMRIRSDKLNATTVIVADLARGRYRAGIQGTVNGYHLEGIGLLDLTTHMDVYTAANGFGIKGRVAVRTRRIDNASARDLLGGQATATANLVMTPEGTIRVTDIRLSSPGVRITSGTGTMWPNGRIDIRAAGVTRAYGALAVVITGTVTRPQVELRAANPGFGIGLRNIRASIRATGNGYAITASGESNYGPFTADVTVLAGRGPMTIDIRRLVFAGITFTGRVVQTRAGPFAGTLTMSGQGLAGTIQLAAAERYQQVAVNATANGATIPGPSPILIQRGIVQATAILYPGAPAVSGDVQLAGVRAANFYLAQARVRGNYRNGTGLAQAFAEGTSGVPFRLAVNAALQPNYIRAAAQGIVNRIPFRLARPVEIRKVGRAWELAPAQLVLPQGQVLLAGRYGNGMAVQARLDNFDISLANAFSPGLGLSGRATGSVDFTQPAGGGFPTADARLAIAGFSRAGIGMATPAVDLALLGQMTPQGASLNAAVRRGTALVGRAQVRLQPLGGGGSWMERLMSAPLAGGIRYNGPADVLWSFSGIADQQLSGPIGVAADFSGRASSPQLTGVIRANNLTFVDGTYGTRITNLALQGRFTSSTLEVTQLSGRAGKGTITGSGTVGFAAASGFPIDLRLHMQDAQLARSDAIGATLTGDLNISNSKGKGALISGDLQMPNVRYQIIRQGAAQVVELAGVRRKGQPLPDPNAAAQQAEAGGTPSVWKLDLRLRAQNQLFISGMGLESEWGADLRIQGTTATPTIVGTAEVLRGTFSFSGQRFELTRGLITFTGSRPPNPRIDIAASADIKDVTVTLNVSGSAYNPQIAFTSSPALPQDEIMARILFGGSVTEISAIQAVQLASSLNALRGGGGGLNPLGKLRSATGFARLRVLGADQTTGRGTSVAAGFYVGKNIYMEVITDARGFTVTQLEIALTKALSILSQVGTQGSSNNVNLRYRKQY